MANEYATYDLLIAPGADYTRQITWTVSDALVNLTGYTASLTVFDVAGTEYFELTHADGIALGGAAGTITITINDTRTSLVTADALYRLDLTSGSTTTRLLNGAVRRATV